MNRDEKQKLAQILDESFFERYQNIALELEQEFKHKKEQVVLTHDFRKMLEIEEEFTKRKNQRISELTRDHEQSTYFTRQLESRLKLPLLEMAYSAPLKLEASVKALIEKLHLAFKGKTSIKGEGYPFCLVANQNVFNPFVAHCDIREEQREYVSSSNLYLLASIYVLEINEAAEYEDVYAALPRTIPEDAFRLNAAECACVFQSFPVVTSKRKGIIIPGCEYNENFIMAFTSEEGVLVPHPVSKKTSLQEYGIMIAHQIIDEDGVVNK